MYLNILSEIKGSNSKLSLDYSANIYILQCTNVFVIFSSLSWQLTKDERSDNEEEEDDEGENSIPEDHHVHPKATNGCGANHH